ncbi:MAG TPA: pimeloyl-ACP methyl ester esterase BioH [Burkholderiales bacterium]|jgi:pimeloyl-[acyl-carrier protein] methyl ester esterase
MQPNVAKRDVVLVHGWGSGASVWQALAPELQPRRSVEMPDLPGYGAAPVCAPYSLEEIAAGLARSAPRRCDVVGWSLGALVALAWAQRAPQQVMRMGLIAATPCFAQRADWQHAAAPPVLARIAGELAADRAGTLRRFISLEAHGDVKAKEVARQLREAHAARDGPAPEALAAGLRLLLETDMRGALASISQPALVIHGDRDSVAPLAAGEHLCRCLPNARLLVLPGAGHAPFISQARTVAAALLDFFDE